MAKKAQYKCYSMRENDSIKCNRFSCIAFNNVGTQNVHINDLLLKPDCSVEFNEYHDVCIESDFNIIFDEESDKENLLNVIETYYYDQLL